MEISIFQLILSLAVAPLSWATGPSTYTSAVIEWEGYSAPESPKIHLKGTIASIYQQLLAINPHYNASEIPQYQKIKSGSTEASSISVSLASSEDIVSVADTAATVSNVQCHPEGEEVGPAIMNCLWLQGNLMQLSGYAKAPAMAPGGHGSCVRAGCEGTSLGPDCSSFLCNDNSFPIWIPLLYIAEDMKVIQDACMRHSADYSEQWLKGQRFRKEADQGAWFWNTIVKSAGC